MKRRIHSVFGQLQLDAGRRYVVLRADRTVLLQQVGYRKVLPRKIHGYHAGFPALLPPAVQQLADLFEHEVVQQADQLGFFKDRDEYAGRKHALFRVVPPDQRFRAVDTAVCQPHFWLKIDFKRAVAQRGRHIVDQVALQLLLLPFFRAIERAELAVAVFAGQVGVVLHPGDGAAAVLDRIGAEAQFEPVAAVA